MTEIKSCAGAVLHISAKDTIKDAIVEAVAAGANLGGAYLAGAYLAGADLAGAYLGGADLARADLAGADLAGADLGGADLGGASLGGAYLAGADLAGAYLAGADLARADLAGAKIVDGGHMLTGYALGYRWWAAPTDRGVILGYGCERWTVAEWREKAKGLAEKHESSRADQYDAFTLALVAMVEVAFGEFASQSIHPTNAEEDSIPKGD